MSLDKSARPSATTNALGASLGRVVGLGGSLVALPFLIRAIGSAGYGHFSTFSALLAMACAIFDLGLATLVARDLSSVSNPAGLLAAVWRSRLWSISLVALAGLGVSAYCCETGRHSWALLGLVLSLGLPWQLAGNLAVTVGFASHRGARVGLIEALGKFGWVIFALVIFVLRAHWLVVFVGSTVLTGLPLLAYRFIAGRHGGNVRERVDTRSVLARSLPLSFFSLIYLAFNRADVLGLSITSSALAVGRYSTCYRVADAILAIVTAAVAVLQPLLSLDSERRAKHEQGRRRIVRLVGWISALGIASSPIWLRILAGSQAGPLRVDVTVVTELGVGVIFYAALQCDLVALVAARRHARAFWLVGAAALVEFVAVALVGRYGLAWAGAAVLGVEVLATLSSAWLCRQADLSGSLVGGGAVAGVVGGLVGCLGVAAGAGVGLGVVLSVAVGLVALTSRDLRREVASIATRLPFGSSLAKVLAR